MTILSALRERLSGRDSAAQSTADSHGDPAGEAQPPFAGYDRLDDRQLIKELRDHSQIELEAVESYERSHKDREPVLNKLRYMRGREPLPGYDALSVEGVVAALDEADLATIKNVRGYERKFANRSEVLEEVVRVQHRRQATQPVSTAPAYQPISATSVARPRGNPMEKTVRP
jgi:hypothetical protein